MKSIELTGKAGMGQRMLVDNEDYEDLIKYKWSLASGYAKRSFRANGRINTVKAQRQIMRPEKNKVVDHINHDKLDNRKRNLRICTQAENTRNLLKTKGGFKGVQKHRRLFQAAIGFNNRHIFLGSFDTAIEAAKAYDKASKKYHGNMGVLNF